MQILVLIIKIVSVGQQYLPPCRAFHRTAAAPHHGRVPHASFGPRRCAAPCAPRRSASGSNAPATKMKRRRGRKRVSQRSGKVFHVLWILIKISFTTAAAAEAASKKAAAATFLISLGACFDFIQIFFLFSLFFFTFTAVFCMPLQEVLSVWMAMWQA